MRNQPPVCPGTITVRCEKPILSYVVWEVKILR